MFRAFIDDMDISPYISEGSGLKPSVIRGIRIVNVISPYISEGSGLKRVC